MFSFAGIIVLLAAVGGTALLMGLAVSAMRRLNQLEGRGIAGSSDLGRVLDQLDAIQDQVAALRAETAELTERVDFSERMLAQSSSIVPPRPTE